MLTSAYDVVAPNFERERALPDGVAEAIRDAVLAAAPAQPRLLDLGAGTGRIGWPFVEAGDDYVGVDLSLGMLREFAQRSPHAWLVQADGLRLPFSDAAFDAIMLVQVFGGLADWQQFAREVQRVLHPGGVVVTGRTVTPHDGVDSRMKRQVDAILGEGGAARRRNVRSDVETLFRADASRVERRFVATWMGQRTPRQFIARHRGGARFVALPDDVKDDAMARLAFWAETEFGSLDASSPESHFFELQLFRYKRMTT